MISNFLYIHLSSQLPCKMRDLILSPCLFNCRVSLNTGFYFLVYKWAWGCCIIKIFIPCFCISCSLFLFKVLSLKKKKKLAHNCCFPIQFCLLLNPSVWCFVTHLTLLSRQPPGSYPSSLSEHPAPLTLLLPGGLSQLSCFPNFPYIYFCIYAMS